MSLKSCIFYFLLPSMLMMEVFRANSQVSVGILPVSFSSNPGVFLEKEQWMELSEIMQENIAEGLNDRFKVCKLSEVKLCELLQQQAIDHQTKLGAENYAVIGKAENVRYLLHSVVECTRSRSESFNVQINAAIIDVENGDISWKGLFTVVCSLKNEEVTVKALMDCLFDPAVSEMIKDINQLKF